MEYPQDEPQPKDFWPHAEEGIALLDVSEEWVRNTLKLPFHIGWENGLGKWKAVETTLTGKRIQLSKHEYDQYFCLYANPDESVDEILNEFLKFTHLDPSMVIWQRSKSEI